VWASPVIIRAAFTTLLTRARAAAESPEGYMTLHQAKAKIAYLRERYGCETHLGSYLFLVREGGGWAVLYVTFPPNYIPSSYTSRIP